MYFVLKLLPTPGEWIEIDIPEGTRDFAVIQFMESFGYINVSFSSGSFDAISVTSQGTEFYHHLVSSGYGTIETEESGRRLIDEFESVYYKS